MTTYNYSYFDNNFDEKNEMDELDRMARELNDKKKKFKLIQNVHEDYFNESVKNKKQLEEYLENENFKEFSTNINIKNENEGTNINDLINNDNITRDSFSSKKSDSTILNNNDSFIKTLNKYENKKQKIKKKCKISNTSNDSTNNEENLSILLEQLKKEHNSHIHSENDSIVSTSDDSIIKHLKKCSKCKSKIKLVFDNNHNNYEKIDNNANALTIKFSDLKEYLIIILLGFLILMVIYIFFRLK